MNGVAQLNPASDWSVINLELAVIPLPEDLKGRPDGARL